MTKPPGLENWDVLPNGQVKFDVLIDAGVTAATPHEVVLRLDYTSAEELNQRKRPPRRRRVQVSMPPKTVADLAALLLRYSKGLEATVPPRDKQN